MKLILITGGCGFIGTNIALEARTRGYEVACMDSLVRPQSEENIDILRSAGCRIVRGDVRSTHDLERIPLPDAVIHLAANPGIPWSINFPKYDFDVNASGTLNILDFARLVGKVQERKIPVIFASTNKVYSDLINEIPITEKKTRFEWVFDADKWETDIFQLAMVGFGEEGISETFPIDGFCKYAHSPYGKSKIAGDLYCQEYYLNYDVPVVINRMSCIYGLHQKGAQDQGWIDHFVRQIYFGNGELNFFGNGKQVRDMLFGEDVARLYLDELENIDKVKGNVFNIGGGKNNTLSLNESIKILEELTGKKAKINYHDWRHADQKIYISDISKVKKLLGWEPKVSPKQGIERMVNYYRELEKSSRVRTEVMGDK